MEDDFFRVFFSFYLITLFGAGKIMVKGEFFFVIVLNKSCMTRHCLGCGAVMSLSSLVTSTMRLCCTFCFCVSLRAPFLFLLLYIVFLQTRTCTRTQSANHSGFGWFLCGECGNYVWVQLFPVGMKRREERGSAQGECLFLMVWGRCVVTAWSEAARHGWVRIRFGVCGSVVIARSVCVVCWLRGCGRIPLAVGLNWRRWWRWVSSLPWWVAAGGVCVFCVEGRILSPAD
ncbi:hypothetical protein Tc00.1047053506951.103 [Trypanosoma cruzi]|uniref:Uncharacterized protein n=1 Tax=Trypanosoma cruzi (strain CL Brener) TaxID=353153 RepID=Q4D6F6_TRYCC|nr:hypothetical protein Tc00.1047053506951.103 [Trypanosoma cruzi]EAN88111.1 hypothetical protein Tc00.1047053506951.103 [Trypanosoma cruzi]|eukprot:XP_809962.1 hypothetical protein [Trypanosoma cruzi strain CL Brener]